MILRDDYQRMNASTRVSWEMPDLIVSTVSTAVEFRVNLHLIVRRNGFLSQCQGCFISK